jgi:hypothetical protein
MKRLVKGPLINAEMLWACGFGLFSARLQYAERTARVRPQNAPGRRGAANGDRPGRVLEQRPVPVGSWGTTTRPHLDHRVGERATAPVPHARAFGSVISMSSRTFIGRSAGSGGGVSASMHRCPKPSCTHPCCGRAVRFVLHREHQRRPVVPGTFLQSLDRWRRGQPGRPRCLPGDGEQRLKCLRACNRWRATTRAARPRPARTPLRAAVLRR